MKQGRVEALAQVPLEAPSESELLEDNRGLQEVLDKLAQKRQWPKELLEVLSSFEKPDVWAVLALVDAECTKAITRLVQESDITRLPGLQGGVRALRDLRNVLDASWEEIRKAK